MLWHSGHLWLATGAVVGQGTRNIVRPNPDTDPIPSVKTPQGYRRRDRQHARSSLCIVAYILLSEVTLSVSARPPMSELLHVLTRLEANGLLGMTYQLRYQIF